MSSDRAGTADDAREVLEAPASAADPRPARVGIQIPPQHATWAQIRSTASTLEEMGVDVLLNWEHHC